MGTVNVAVARLVAAVRVLLDTDGWVGVGIQSPEHWVTWKAGVARSRAEGLVTIARRAGELPACWALFESGRLGEDAMVRIARRVPAARDAEIAALAPTLLISQLDRLLRSLPEQADDTTGRPEPERMLRLRRGPRRVAARPVLPPRRRGRPRPPRTDRRPRRRVPRPPRPRPPPDVPADARAVTWADGLVRMATEAADALDPTLARTGQRGERNTVVLHHDVDPHGTLGPGQLELGPVVPDAVARYLACDARVQVMTYRMGQLMGINPTERTPNRALRRYLARRDQGCTHPLCTQKLWLHAHHIQHWEHGGLTVPANLALLCPTHHRALHHGQFSIEGDPEAGTLRFHDPWGHPIDPTRARPTTDPGGPRPGGGPRPTPHPRRTPHRRHLRLELSPTGRHGRAAGAGRIRGVPCRAMAPPGSPKRRRPGLVAVPADGEDGDAADADPGEPSGDEQPGASTAGVDPVDAGRRRRVGPVAAPARPARRVFDPIYDKWLRVEWEGFEKIPARAARS